MKTDLFHFCGHCWVFQICWHIECSTFRVSSFRIWNSSTGIPSPPLALFVVMLSKPTWLSLVSGKTTGRGHSPSLQQKVGLKIYWAWPRPSEQDLIPPTVSLSHGEASINLLSSSITGQTEWKHSHRKLIKLVTLTTALSNSMKLWAMPCRATQNRRVMVGSSDKT